MQVVQIPLLKDNYAYLIVCPESREAAILDPSEGEPAFARIQNENVNLTSILNTHHHRDHTGGNPFLLERRALRVYGHGSDQDRIPGLTHPLGEGDEVTVGKLTGRVFFIPGHTKGHIAYLFGDSLFCGDTLFVAGCGRLFEGTPEQMLDSLSRLRALPGETRVYCGHEYTEKNLEFALTIEPRNPEIPAKLARVRELRAAGTSTVPSTILEEKETNPFLRWDSREIQDNLKERLPDLKLDPVSVFAEIRKLKDAY